MGNFNFEVGNGDLEISIGWLAQGGHSADTHTGGVSPRKFPATQKYHFSFTATQKYHLILYLETSK